MSELAAVVLYLRHVVRPGDLLIIEEPEAHLHPDAQATLTGILAGAAADGINVLITTHSKRVLEALAATGTSRTRGDVTTTGEQAGLHERATGVWKFTANSDRSGTTVERITDDRVVSV